MQMFFYYCKCITKDKQLVSVENILRREARVDSIAFQSTQNILHRRKLSEAGFTHPIKFLVR